MNTTPLTTNNPQLKLVPSLSHEQRKRLLTEIGSLSLELTYKCIFHALKTALPPNIEDLLGKLLEKRKKLYRDDALNGNLSDGGRLLQMQENEDCIK
ncbi:MAG: hypothetical protein Q9207_008425, partial [Kuettlingeria erythrocarpa]